MAGLFSVVMEKICARLGVGLTERKVNGDRPVIEIAGVNVAAIEAASSRREGIKPVIDELTKEFIEKHGYAPNKKQLIGPTRRLCSRPHDPQRPGAGGTTQGPAGGQQRDDRAVLEHRTDDPGKASERILGQ
ncbi:hypothetical protein J3A64_003279 [Pseudarthrobacter sp. PvP004]|nr:hypothetical protein [Pseudarthrobacter sp. PvP004]